MTNFAGYVTGFSEIWLSPPVTSTLPLQVRFRQELQAANSAMML
jgi:hypothetical protein